MKVLMLSWEYPPRKVGGIASHVYGLTKEMNKGDCHVVIITCHEAGLPQFEINAGVHIYRVIPYEIQTYHITQWAFNMNCAMMEKVASIMEKEGPFDLVHAHDWMVAFAAEFVKNRYGIPLISTIHATEFGRNNGLHNDIQRYISNIEWWLTYKSYKVICCSKYMQNQLTSFFQLPKDKTEVIYNGVNPEEFETGFMEPEFKANYAAMDEKVVFFIGRHVHEKGLQTFIDAIPLVLKRYKRVKFIIAGQGPMTEHIKHRAIELGIYSRIYFTGYVDDQVRNKLYHISDIAVFPSLYEPFGIVALEGMAARTPVIASDTGGLREIIDHGIDGYKFEPGNPHDLADNIVNLLHNPKTGMQFAQKGYEKVSTLFNWSEIAKQTLKLYEKVLYQHGSCNFFESENKTEEK